jgi:cytochrome c oxidase cbb3-type subunit 2
MNRFRSFLAGLAVTFALPWFFLVARPFAAISQIEPVAYDPDADGEEGVFPPGRSGNAKYGELVYRREGCANCHTQVIRPDYIGQDPWKPAFGMDAAAVEPSYVRESLPHDYLGEDHALIGYVRNGPDLANVGFRRPDRDWHHRHLYDPRQIHQWSSMPSFRHLYDSRRIDGPVPDGALVVEAGREPGVFLAVVPSYEAEALVDYLLSLRMKQNVPAALKGTPAGGTGAGAAAAE